MNSLFSSYNPTNIRQPFGNYVHGIAIPEGSQLFYTSGQLGTSKDDATPECASEQARICFRNIEAILAQNQMNFKHVFKVNAFVTAREYFTEYMSVRDEFIQHAVASTLLIVGGFTRPEFKIEIEVIAAKPQVK